MRPVGSSRGPAGAAGEEQHRPWSCLAKGAPAALWVSLAAGLLQVQPCGCCRQASTCCLAGPMLRVHLLWVEPRSSVRSASLPLIQAPLMGLASGLCSSSDLTHNTRCVRAFSSVCLRVVLVSDAALGPNTANSAGSLLAATCRSSLAFAHLLMLTCRSMERFAPCTRPASPRVTWS